MRLLLSLAAALLAVTANAQQNFEYWPNANYDPAIPTIELVLGYAPGERIDLSCLPPFADLRAEYVLYAIPLPAL